MTKATTEEAGCRGSRRVCLLFTSHRQVEELALAASFLRRCSALVRGADVVVHNNCAESILPSALLEAHLALFPNANRRLVRSRENAGYKWGPFQQVSACLPLVREYDFVVHLHPDVYLADDSSLCALIEGCGDDDPAALLVNELHLAHVQDAARAAALAGVAPGAVPAYSFDFFVLRPRLLARNVFDAYLDAALVASLGPAMQYPEMLLFRAIHEMRVPHRVFARHKPSASHADARFPDLFGLWHSHDNALIRRFLRREGGYLSVETAAKDAKWYHCERCGDGGAGKECMRCRAQAEHVASNHPSTTAQLWQRATTTTAVAAAALVLLCAAAAAAVTLRRTYPRASQ
mmetsp:Transcript_27758/g.90840  ORF Transcript_27758/g.90840 Transcript_27758/m.90840 type:complete len:348 (+) Transcript_27758:89-1132(+)